MTPADLKAWRERLGLTQAEAAHLLGVGHRAYQRHEEGGVFCKTPPGYADAATYGVEAALDKAEGLLLVSDWHRGPRRFWNTTMPEEEMHWQMRFAVAKHIIGRGDLSGSQRVSYPGHSMPIIFPPDSGNQARYKRSTRWKAWDPDP
jgi:transcriptional regulator with XRE-family HTH domain